MIAEIEKTIEAIQLTEQQNTKIQNEIAQLGEMKGAKPAHESKSLAVSNKRSSVGGSVSGKGKDQ